MCALTASRPASFAPTLRARCGKTRTISGAGTNRPRSAASAKRMRSPARLFCWHRRPEATSPDKPSWLMAASRLLDQPAIAAVAPTRPARKRTRRVHGAAAKKFPAISLAQAHALLTRPGSPFEMEERDIRGVRTRVWKNAPPTMRELFQMARAHGDKTFVVYGDERVTYEEFARAAL